MSEVPVDPVAEILGGEGLIFIFTSTGEWFQLSNLRTDAPMAFEMPTGHEENEQSF